MLFSLHKNKTEDMVVGQCVANPSQKVGECRLSLLVPLASDWQTSREGKLFFFFGGRVLGDFFFMLS